MLLSWYLLFLPLSPKITIYILDMNVEEAFKLVISAGVVTPNSVKIKDEE